MIKIKYVINLNPLNSLIPVVLVLSCSCSSPAVLWNTGKELSAVFWDALFRVNKFDLFPETIVSVSVNDSMS